MSGLSVLCLKHLGLRVASHALDSRSSKQNNTLYMTSKHCFRSPFRKTHRLAVPGILAVRGNVPAERPGTRFFRSCYA